VTLPFSSTAYGGLLSCRRTLAPKSDIREPLQGPNFPSLAKEQTTTPSNNSTRKNMLLHLQRWCAVS